MNDLVACFRRNVRLAMEHREMSQYALAQSMNVSRQVVWQYLNETKPGIDMIAKFAEALEIEPHVLLKADMDEEDLAIRVNRKKRKVIA